MRIAIVGSGYVGLVSGACLAEIGHDVICVDRDRAKVQRLRRGDMPIFEPGLAELVAANVAVGRLSFTTELGRAVADADAVFIAVGTPPRADGHADLSHVHAAAREIARSLTGFTVIAVKSTVPVGTGDDVEAAIRKARPGADFCVVSNPEFLREGAAITDFMQPDRIVVGLEDERARPVMAAVYRPLGAVPMLFVSRRASELIKYAANSFLAMKVTFINEIANLSEAVGANVQDIAAGIGLDNRIGPKFLNAGPGIGGSCFPKDMNALVATARSAGVPIRLVETTIEVNRNRRLAMAQKIAGACGGTLAGRTVAVLGLTFKPNTDDIRESPAMAIVSVLISAGARVRAYDPQGMGAARQVLPQIACCADAYDAARGADALAVLTEWDEFRTLDLDRIGRAMRRRALVDLRNIYRPADATRFGFTYDSVGRPAAPERFLQECVA